MRPRAGDLGLLAFIHCLLHRRAAALVLGVAPDEQGKYAGEQFRCLDGRGGPLPASAVNDEYCDCLDGSDEPGTGACAGEDTTLFYCANEGSTPRRIYASRVGDGICDCCDGSDEASLVARASKAGAKAGCANICAEHGRVEREVQDRRLQELQKGVAKREEIRQSALVEREAWKGEIQQLAAALPTLEEALKVAEVAANEERAAQKAAEDAAKAAEEAENSTSPCMWRQTGGCTPTGTREPQHDKRCYATVPAGSSGFCDCDGDNQKGENEPGFDCSGGVRQCREKCGEGGGAAGAGGDEALPADDEEEKPQVSEYAKWMDGASEALGGSEGEAKEAKGEEDPQVSEYAKWMEGAESMTGSADAAAPAPGAEQAGAVPAGGDAAGGAQAEPAKPSAIDVETEARKKVQANKDRARELQEKLDAVPDDHLGYASLIGKTITKRVAEFTYKVSFFSNAMQDSTSLGRWAKWTGPRSGVFEGGTMCWGGPERQLNVKFQCGIEEALEDAFEPSRCVYEATVTHPGACEPAELELLASGKRVVGPRDEL